MELTHLRAKILVPFILALAVLLGLIIFHVHQHREKERQLMVDILDAQVARRLQTEMREESERLTGFGLFMQYNKLLQQAWQARDRETLLAATLPIYRSLEARYHVAHLYFYDRHGQVVLRPHEPQLYGDKPSRPSLKTAIRRKETVYGLEFDQHGHLLLRMVMPWFIDGQLTGYMELAEGAEHLLNHMARATNFAYAISVSPRYLREHPMAAVVRLADTDKTATQIPLLSVNTDDRVWLEDAIRGLKLSTTLNRHQRVWLLSQVPLEDSTGVVFGHLNYAADVTGRSLALTEFSHHIIISVLIIGGIILVFYFAWARFLGRHLQGIYQRLNLENRRRREAEQKLLERKEALEAMVESRTASLVESQRRYKTLFDKSADALLIIEGNAFVDCNQAALDMLGYDTRQELYQTHPSVLSPEFQPDGERSEVKADRMIALAFRHGSHRFEWEHKRKNGEVFPVEVLLTAIPWRETQLLHVVWRDITERRRAAEEIEFQAMYDALTRLPNRRLLLDRLQQSWVAAQRHGYCNALLFLDIDRFKTINDSLGHSIGDALLCQLAERIATGVRQEDTAARFGGDEFVVLLRHAGESTEAASLHAEKVANVLRDVIAMPVLVEEQELHVTASIGIVVFPDQENTVDDVIKHADTAMYCAKDQGRNSVSFYLTEMQERVVHRLVLEKDLRKAVAEQQIQVWYQPQLNPHGQVVAVEALARWQHPSFGFVNPEDFIAIAEETGAIFALGDYILQRALADLSDIEAATKHALHLSVNISQKQFGQSNFVTKLAELLDATGIAPGRLTLEITEGMAIQNLERTISLLQQLRDLGVYLSLDDFGTGYSSLSHLKRLPLDELKVDKTFVFDVIDDPLDARLVTTILNIGKQFGLKTVAEGVETQAQLQWLQQRGCDLFQGYYFSRPLPLAQLREFLV